MPFVYLIEQVTHMIRVSIDTLHDQDEWKRRENIQHNTLNNSFAADCVNYFNKKKQSHSPNDFNLLPQ